MSDSNTVTIQELKSSISGCRILMTCTTIVMVLSIAQGHNSVGLLFLGLTIVIICFSSNYHSDKIYMEELYNPPVDDECY